MALFDPGACCCLIHPTFLEKLQKYGYIPVVDSDVKIEGIVPDKFKTTDRVAYLSFKLETGYQLRKYTLHCV